MLSLVVASTCWSRQLPHVGKLYSKDTSGKVDETLKQMGQLLGLADLPLLQHVIWGKSFYLPRSQSYWMQNAATLLLSCLRASELRM